MVLCSVCQRRGLWHNLLLGKAVVHIVRVWPLLVELKQIFLPFCFFLHKLHLFLGSSLLFEVELLLCQGLESLRLCCFHLLSWLDVLLLLLLLLLWESLSLEVLLLRWIVGCQERLQVLVLLRAAGLLVQVLLCCLLSRHDIHHRLLAVPYSIVHIVRYKPGGSWDLVLPVGLVSLPGVLELLVYWIRVGVSRH